MSGKTEWEDALMKHGIIDTPEAPEAEIWRFREEVDQEEKERRRREATLDELDEMENDGDDDDEEAIMAALRRKRIAQMKAEAAKNKFGNLSDIRRNDWEREVTNGCFSNAVIVLLWKAEVDGCRLVSECVQAVARKFRAVKFVRIISTEAIPNFPDQRLPTILVYHKDDPIKQLSGITEIGDTPELVEWTLHHHNVIQSDMEEPERVSKLQIRRK